MTKRRSHASFNKRGKSVGMTRPHRDPIVGVSTRDQNVELIITKVDPSTLPPMRSRKRKLPP